MIPELERLGRDLEAAAARAPRPRRLPLGATILLALLALAVPAAATRPPWAPLIAGETARPSQAARELQVRVADGVGAFGAPWQLVAYRARLRDGTPGTCVYLLVHQAGSGSCGAPGGRLALARDDSSGTAIVHGLLAPSVSRVELRLRDGRRRVIRPRLAQLPPGREGARPTDLRVLLAELGPTSRRPAVAAVVARDARGRVVQRMAGP